MQLLTHSRMRTYRECARKHHLSYVDGYRPRESGAALRFGSLWHEALEAFWVAIQDGAGVDRAHSVACESLIRTTRFAAVDEFESARARALLCGYREAWRYHVDSYDVVAVEAEFVGPLLNPDTWKPSRTWAAAGKIDLVLRERSTGRTLVGEHKTTSEAIDSAADYWERLQLDHQISHYTVGALSLGLEVDAILYDVARKPRQRPYEATPIESRKYRKDGQLYANQREHDERPVDYYNRLLEPVLDDLDGYFAIREVPRTESQIQAYMDDAWALAKAMRADERHDRSPRNPDACHRFGRCPYWDHCAAGVDLSIDDRFVRLDDPNPELSGDDDGEDDYPF